MSNFSAFVIMYNRRIIICTLKSFMNDRLQLSLDGYDIFNKNKVRSGARLNDIIMNSISKDILGKSVLLLLTDSALNVQ